MTKLSAQTGRDEPGFNGTKLPVEAYFGPQNGLKGFKKASKRPQWSQKGFNGLNGFKKVSMVSKVLKKALAASKRPQRPQKSLIKGLKKASTAPKGIKKVETGKFCFV